MKVIAYQVTESKDVLIVDLHNCTVERQDTEGNVLWREMFLDVSMLTEYVESLIQDHTIYGAVM